MRSIKRFSALALLVAVLFLFARNSAFADSCTSSGSGDWSVISWSCGHIPTSGDDVIVANGHTVLLDVDATVRGITINNTGTFNNGSKTLTANTNGPYLTNNGTFNGQTGKYVFAGSGTGGVYGSSATTFNDVDISIGVDFKGSGAPDNATVNGTLTIKSGGFVSTNAPYYATGSTLKYDTGGVYGAGAEWAAGASSGAGVPYHVQTSTSGTSVNFGSSTSSRTARGNITIDSGTFLALSTASGGDLVLGGSLANNGNSGTAFTANSRRVTFNGTGTQTITSSNGTTTNFAYLTLDMGTSNANVLDVQSVITGLAGELTLTNGTFKLSSASTITPFSGGESIPSTAGFHLHHASAVSNWGSTGSLTVNGLLRIDNGTMTIGTGTGNRLELNGSSVDFTVNGGTLNVTGRFDEISVGSGSTVSVSGGTINLSTAGQINTSNPVMRVPNTSNFNMSGGTIVIQNANQNTGQADLSISNPGGGITRSFTGGTIQIGKGAGTTGNITISSAPTLYNLVVDANSTTPSLSAALSLNNNLTITSGTLSAGSNNISIAGNFSNSGAFTPGTGTVTFNGSGTQNLAANNSTTFNNLTVNLGVTLVETVSPDNVSVSGTLTNNGTIRKSQSVSGTGSKTFGLAGAYNGANLAINVTTQGSLTNLQVNRIDSNHPSANTPQQTGRYWTITPSGGGYTANLTLPRSNSGAPSVCKHISGTSWSCAANSSNSNDVTRNNISSFSDWAVGNDAPTSAVLISFKAKLTPKHKVKAKWETGTELDVLGFNLYRQTVGSKKWVKVNGDVPIDAQNIGKPEGALYTWIDKKVQSGKAYRYKLEALRTSGPSEWSDVVQVTIP